MEKKNPGLGVYDFANIEDGKQPASYVRNLIIVDSFKQARYEIPNHMVLEARRGVLIPSQLHLDFLNKGSKPERKSLEELFV